MAKKVDPNYDYKKAASALAAHTGVKIDFHKMKIDDFEVSYVEAGKGDPIIFIHGLNMGWGQWFPNIPYFAKKYKVYAINLPGSADSDPVKRQELDLYKHFVQTIEKFIENKDIKNAVVIGHSSGGWLAIKIGLIRPELISKVVVVSPVGFTKFIPVRHLPIGFMPLVNLLVKTVQRATVKNMAAFFASVMKKGHKIKKEFFEYYMSGVQRSEHNHPFYFINFLVAPFRVKSHFVFKDEELRKITWPTLIIGGQHDPITRFRLDQFRRFDLIRNSEVVVFDNSGHVAPMEESEKFNKLVDEFIKQK